MERGIGAPIRLVIERHLRAGIGVPNRLAIGRHPRPLRPGDQKRVRGQDAAHAHQGGAAATPAACHPERRGQRLFFAGATATIGGIPGGPFGTATGADSFKFRDNFLFTLGGALTVPINGWWSFAFIGGFAEVNNTVTYNCINFCAVQPAAPAFSASTDVWLAGGYIGGRLQVPLLLPAFPGAKLGFDYKHVFLGSENVILGSAAQARIVNLNVSQDIDLFTLRLAIPVR
jgi:hypothetical protein